MKKFIIAVMALAVIAIVAYGVAYFVMPVQSIELEEFTHEATLHCDDVYIVRDETVYYAKTSGTVYNSIPEGKRASANTVISTTFNANVDGEQLKKLHTIDEKIARLQQESSGSELYSIDRASVENEISQDMNRIYEYARNNDVQEIHEIRNTVNKLREGSDVSVSDEILALESERASVAAEIPGPRTETIADRSGIFSSYIDGLEAVLAPDRAESFTPSYIRSLETHNSRSYNNTSTIIGDPVCKIMNNHSWYVLGIISQDQKGLFDEYKKLNIRFSDISDTTATGELVYISEPDENGECVFLIEVQSYMEIAFSYRKLNADIVFKTYSGYKIPTEAIRTGDTINSYYVYGMKGSDSFKCECDVLYTDIESGYSIIQSTSDAANKLASMDRLVVGER